MSQQKRNSSDDIPANAAEELGFGARVVAIPKPIVVLQEPKRESRAITDPNYPEQKPLPKSQKPMQPSDRVGDILRAARLERGDDLYLIAEYLCIKPGFLIAIENSRYDEFPADAYIVGFLKSYANLLGIDGNDAVERYRYEMAGRRKKPVLSMPTPVTEGRAPSALIMVGATIAVLLIYALWYGISSSNRAELHNPQPLPTIVQPVPESSAPDAGAAAGLTAPVTLTPTPLVPASSSTIVPPETPSGIVLNGAVPAGKEEIGKAPPEDKTPIAKDAKPAEQDTKDAGKDANAQVFGDSAGSRITIRALQSSWIMVTDDSGKTLFDHVLKTGESYKVPNKTGLSLTTGNGGGIVLSLDGKDLPKIATGSPHVVRNITLDPDHLAAEATGQ